MDDETRQLASLMDELSNEPAPDPGALYWHQFNHRLQSAILTKRNKSSRTWLPLTVLAAAAAWLIFAMLPKSPSLDRLTDEELAYLELVLETDVTSQELMAFDLGQGSDIILDAFHDENMWQVKDLSPEELDAFSETWRSEG